MRRIHSPLASRAVTFTAHISTEFDIPLPESACVYCANCIGVCPTGALMFKTEYDMRAVATWNEAQQTRKRVKS
jgi:formate hydrogenlyase subunit 6/NADH:ubiquinone oxidoreductase subunit I